MDVKPRPQRSRSFLRFIKALKLYSVYVLSAEGQPYCKIGISDDPIKRFNGIQSGNWNALVLSRHWWTSGRPLSYRVEQAVLKAMGDRVERGEWLKATPEEIIEEVERQAVSMEIPIMDEEDLLPVAEEWDLMVV